MKDLSDTSKRILPERVTAHLGSVERKAFGEHCPKAIMLLTQKRCVRGRKMALSVAVLLFEVGKPLRSCVRL